jgi:hypothetical protein
MVVYHRAHDRVLDHDLDVCRLDGPWPLVMKRKENLD